MFVVVDIPVAGQVGGVPLYLGSHTHVYEQAIGGTPPGSGFSRFSRIFSNPLGGKSVYSKGTLGMLNERIGWVHQKEPYMFTVAFISHLHLYKTSVPLQHTSTHQAAVRDRNTTSLISLAQSASTKHSTAP